MTHSVCWWEWQIPRLFSQVCLSKENGYLIAIKLMTCMHTTYVSSTLTWMLTWPAFEGRVFTVCAVDICLLRIFRNTAPATTQTAGMQLGVLLSYFWCHSLSPAAANNTRNVSAVFPTLRPSHSSWTLTVLTCFFLSTGGGSLLLANDTHSYGPSCQLPSTSLLQTVGALTLPYGMLHISYWPGFYQWAYTFHPL